MRAQECSLFFSSQGLKNVTVIEGESVTLECHISGYPSPKVTWYREDYQIESSIDFQITFQGGIARLMIREAFAEDSGRFTCSAVNEAGTVSTSCYLAVQGLWLPLLHAIFCEGHLFQQPHTFVAVSVHIRVLFCVEVIKQITGSANSPHYPWSLMEQAVGSLQCHLLVF